MLSLGIAAIVGMLVTLLGTPVAVKQFRRRGWGQLIREEGPKAHYEKRGTPTMGGLVILAGCILGYLAGHIGSGGFNPFRDSGLLALFSISAFALLGFADDFIKIRKARSLGLRSSAKFAGQLVIAVVFAYSRVGVRRDWRRRLVLPIDRHQPRDLLLSVVLRDHCGHVERREPDRRH